MCDNSASYQPKPKAQAVKYPWASVSDVSGRGFKPDSSDFGQQRKKRNQGTGHNLDEGNRFFTDNKSIYDNYGAAVAKGS